MYKTIFKRFLKGFFAGGLSSVAVALNAGFTITSLEDIKQFGFALVVAFLTGGILATEKALNWREMAELHTDLQ